MKKLIYIAILGFLFQYPIFSQNDEARTQAEADAFIKKYVTKVSAIPSLQKRIQVALNGLANSNPYARDGGAQVLAKIGPKAAEAVPALIPLLRDEVWQVRLSVAKTLGAMGPAAKPAVSALVAVSKDSSAWPVQIAALDALGSIGPGAKSAAPALKASLRDRYWKIRVSAAKSLGRLNDKSALSGLKKALKDKEWPVREAAILGLMGMGKKAAPAIKEITRALNDREWKVQSAAAETLARLGSDAVSAIPILKANLRSKNHMVRYTSVYALSKIGGEQVLPLLKRATKDKYWKIRQFATSAHRKLEYKIKKDREKDK